MTTAKKRILVVLVIAAMACIAVMIVRSINSRKVEKIAYRWASSATLEEMEPGTFSVSGESEYRTLTDDARRELLSLLNDLPESAFERCADNPSLWESAVRVNLYGGVGLGYLEEKNRVFIAIIIGDGGSVSELAEWDVDSEELEKFMADLRQFDRGEELP